MFQKINKPWGYFQVLDNQSGFLVKKIYVKSQAKLSLQSHNHRSEHWIVVDGKATVSIDENIYNLGINESIYVPLGSKHRIENNSGKKLVIIEVQIGEILKEDDIIRYQDIYGRKISS